MTDEDFAEVSVLLDVVHKAVTAGPAYGWFGQMASKRLTEIKDQAEKAIETPQPTFSGLKLPGDPGYKGDSK